MKHVAVILSLLLGTALAASLAVGYRRATRDAAGVERVRTNLPSPNREGRYVSSARCEACHPGEHASWRRSFHRTMTQAALPANVVGAFDGTTVVSDGLDYRVGRTGDAFWAEMPDPDIMMYVVQGGRKLRFEEIPRVKRPVVMTTGSHHYQTYWVASERYGGLLQTLPLVYLISDKRWIPREEAFMRGPDDRGRFITQWNHHCIRCHSTGGNPGLDDATGLLRSKVGELGIACEACHGPGEDHVRRHQNPVERYSLRLSGRPDPTIVNPARLDHRLSSEVCGQCHGVFMIRKEYAMDFAHHGPLYKPGEDFEKTRYFIDFPRPGAPKARWEELRLNPEFYRERWWDDGTMLAGGREFTAMSSSGCYTRGSISCLSCHSMHQSDPVGQVTEGLNSSRACTQCHGEARFTSKISTHTFHRPNSSGSNCLNCHMPRKSYALLKGIRSHQIDSPQVASSARFGVPNACNLCHLDKTLAWTDGHLVQWYGQAPVPLTDQQRTTSAALLWLLKGHAAQRAIAAWHFGWQPALEVSGTNWLAPFEARLLADPYGVVRYVAGHALRRLPGFSGFPIDFQAGPAERSHKVEEAVNLWRRSTARPSRVGIEVLIGPDGRLMEDRVKEFLDERDERPVTIQE